MPDNTPGVMRALKQALIGSPLRTVQVSHERLSNPVALAVFASDALSSVAYATEEILVVLTLANAAAISYAFPISIVISLLVAIVTLSYRQLIFAYPEGGGAYTVARENLSQLAGNVAGAALMISYVLTVAVSTAAGISAVVSAFPGLHEYRVPLCVAAVTIVTLGNLRGVRESGALFSIPSYVFIGAFFTMIGWGLYQLLTGTFTPATYPDGHLQEVHNNLPGVAVTSFLLFRGFSSGCTALTGIEAISNGTSAFRAPEDRNATTVMGWMSAILAVLFLGISYLAIHYKILPYEASQEGYQTVVSQLAFQISGGRGFFYYLVQGTTTIILLLAANTAFAGFPRLASLIAQDGFLPRQFATLGDRLVFTNGIVILALTSIFLLIVFGGDTHALMPLYAFGVFLGFVLAQFGMVAKWLREKSPGWRYSMGVNLVGGTVTLVVMLVVGASKFREGAWIVIVLIPLLIWLFRSIKSHYVGVAGQLSLEGHEPPETDPKKVFHTVIVPIGGLQWSVVRALQYAKSLAPDDVRAVYVNLNPDTTAKLQERWAEWGLGIPLVILNSPYRSILDPLLRYVDLVRDEPHNDFVTVLLPEFVTKQAWHAALHNQTAILIRTFLTFREGVVVTSVRHHLDA